MEKQMEGGVAGGIPGRIKSRFLRMGWSKARQRSCANFNRRLVLWITDEPVGPDLNLIISFLFPSDVRNYQGQAVLKTTEYVPRLKIHRARTPEGARVVW